MFILRDTYFFDRLHLDIESVVSLTGNSGKKVRLVLERYVTDGVIDQVLPTRPDSSLLAFGVYMARITNAVEMAQSAVSDHGSTIKFSLQEIDVAKRSYRLVIELGSIPDTMGARQELLQVLDHGVARIRAMVDPQLFAYDSQDDQEFQTVFFQDMYSENPESYTAANCSLGLAQFEAIVNGDFTSIEDIASGLLDVACVLNPKAVAAVEASEAEGTRMLDAAWAYLRFP